MRYLMRLSVPRAGEWRAWGIVRDEFGRQLAGQARAAIALHVDSEVCRGRGYVRGVIVATVDAADVTEAPDLAWWTFQKAAGATSPNGRWPTLRPRCGQKGASSRRAAGR